MNRTRFYLLAGLHGILLLLLSGCAATVSPDWTVPDKSPSSGNTLPGNALLESLRKNDYSKLSGTLLRYGGPLVRKEEFLHSQKEFSKQFGSIVSYRYLTELETPLFRNCLWVVTLERKGENDRKIRQELLFRLVMAEKGKNGKPQIVGMGFF